MVYQTRKTVRAGSNTRGFGTDAPEPRRHTIPGLINGAKVRVITHTHVERPSSICQSKSGQCTSY